MGRGDGAGREVGAGHGDAEDRAGAVVGEVEGSRSALGFGMEVEGQGEIRRVAG